MDKLRVIVAVSLLVLWVLSLVVNLVDRSYEVPAYVNIFAGAAVTFLFGLPIINRHPPRGGE